MVTCLALSTLAGEKEVTIRQIFTAIAVKLKLRGAQLKDHNR